MKALTTWQPWAQLLAIGAKRFETRPWPTDYRGPVAIHAGCRWLADEAGLCWRPAFRDELERAGIAVPGPKPTGRRFPKILPLGCVVGVAELVDVVACWPRPADVDDVEVGFGDWGPGRFGLRFENAVVLREPVAAQGFLGLFTLSAAAAAAVASQLQGAAR